MTSEIDKPRERFEERAGNDARVQREGVGSLVPGEYWRALKRVAFEYMVSNGMRRMGEDAYVAEKGEVLLLVDVRKEKDTDHTCVLAPHPAKGDPEARIRILVGDFLAKFEYAPDGPAVRELEVREAQLKITAIQEDITKAQTNPAYLNSRVLSALADSRKATKAKGGLPAVVADVNVLNVLKAEAPSLSQAIEHTASGGIQRTLDMVASATQLAEAQGRFFQERTGDLVQAVQNVTPFMVERAQVALARTGSAIARAQSLLESVSTLTLFTGKEVTVTKVRDGLPAPAGEVIGLFQRRLFADEECAFLSQYVHGVDDAKSQFISMLKSKKSTALLDLLIPSPRGVVLMAWSRQRRYDIEDKLLASMVEHADKRSWLLVRDGQQAFIVDSPVGSHEGAELLFPDTDVDGKIFGGLDGAQVTPEDLVYTDKLEELHRFAVHYRRFAVVLAGLVSREVCWKGVDYRDLFAAARTDSIFRLIFDATGDKVVADQREGIDQYLSRINGTLRSGSRVLVDWSEALTHATVPQAFRWERGRDGGHYALHYKLVDGADASPAVLERDGTSLVVKVRMTHRWKYEATERTMVVRLYDKGAWLVNRDRTLLALDGLDPATLDRLLARRSERVRYMDYMRRFKIARDLAERHLRDEAPARSAIAIALVEAKLADTQRAEAIAMDCMAAWRVETGKVPSVGTAEFTTLLDRAFKLTRAGSVDEAAVSAMVATEGVSPLRLALDAEGRTLLYAAPKTRDDRGSRQLEVDRYVVNSSGSGLRLSAPVSEIMYASAPDQTILKEWAEAEGFAVTGEPKITLRRKQALLEEIEARLGERRRLMAGPIEPADADALVAAYRAARVSARSRNRSRSVPDLVCTLPLGLIETAKAVKVLVLVAGAETCLLRNLPAAQAAVVEETYVKQFRNQEYAREACAEMRKQTAFNPSILAVTAQEYRTGRDLFEARDWEGSYVYWPLISKGRRNWAGDRWTYSREETDLTTLKRALTPTRFKDRTMMGEAGGDITGVWLHPAIDLAGSDPFVSFLIAGGGAITPMRKKIDRN